jgi:nucleoside-diphosphate-sugar epimerase
MMHVDDTIFVAGYRGLVGSTIVKQLNLQGYNNIICKNKQELDLTRLNNLGWHKKIDFEKALTNTYHWYLNNQKNKVF